MQLCNSLSFGKKTELVVFFPTIIRQSSLEITFASLISTLSVFVPLCLFWSRLCLPFSVSRFGWWDVCQLLPCLSSWFRLVSIFWVWIFCFRMLQVTTSPAIAPPTSFDLHVFFFRLRLHVLLSEVPPIPNKSSVFINFICLAAWAGLVGDVADQPWEVVLCRKPQREESWLQERRSTRYETKQENSEKKGIDWVAVSKIQHHLWITQQLIEALTPSDDFFHLERHRGGKRQIHPTQAGRFAIRFSSSSLFTSGVLGLWRGLGFMRKPRQGSGICSSSSSDLHFLVSLNSTFNKSGEPLVAPCAATAFGSRLSTLVLSDLMSKQSQSPWNKNNKNGKLENPLNWDSYLLVCILQSFVFWIISFHYSWNFQHDHWNFRFQKGAERLHSKCF